MKKIHHILLESNNKLFENIVIDLIKLLPENFKVTNNILYYNKNNDKCTIILSCTDSFDIIIIKFYKNKYKTIPEELIYLSKYYNNHYFYQNCYLAYCHYNNYNISIIKCKKADGDIINLKMNINKYIILYNNILDELYNMHINGFVHMDIKRSNILYKKTKYGIIFGLCDFDLVNLSNTKINPIFKRYYYKLYRMNIPEIYTEKFEKNIFQRLLYFLKINKKIIANTV